MSVGDTTSIRFDGLATGLDTGAIIDAILDVERLPLLGTQSRQSAVEVEQELFRTLNTMLLGLADAAKAIDNQNDLLTGFTLDEEFLDFSVVSGDESIVTATANGDASPGSFEVTVTKLAQVGREISDGFAAQDTVIATSGQTMSIDFGGAAPIDITVGAAGATLEELRDLINGDPNNVSGVRAEILYDGTSYRLIVSGEATGAANDIAITTDIDGAAGAGSPFFDSNLGEDAIDAEINVLGVDVTRPSNTITDVIPGVTLSLEGVTGTQPPTTLTVNHDEESIEEKLQALVDAYNVIRDFSIAQSEYNEETELAGPLSGDSTLRGIERDLQVALTGSFSFAGNPFVSLADIGIRFESDGGASEGRLELDTDVLQAALATDAAAVRELLSGDGTTDGAATALARLIEPMTQSGTGLLAGKDAGFDAQIKVFDETIERMERRLALRELTLISQYAALESLISGLQADQGFLASLLNQNSDN